MKNYSSLIYSLLGFGTDIPGKFSQILSFMKIPSDVKVHELSSSYLWIDESGIVYSTPKPGTPPDLTVEQLKKEMEILRSIIGPQKVCFVLESNSDSKPPKREQRDLIAAELASVTKAMAIVTNSPLSRMIANLFFGLKPPPYPAKMFTNEADAREWVLQFTEKENSPKKAMNV
jgi:hypothetical protein